jgi:dTDP-4-dehydrorhamnose reductase
MGSLSEASRILEYNATPPVLVLGVPGVPGFNAFLGLTTYSPGSVLGIAPPHVPELRVPESPWSRSLVSADPENIHELAAICETHSINTVVDASGWCALRSCEMDPVLGRRLNVAIGLNAMRVARDRGARLIRLSTDLVFDGNPRPAADGAMALGGYREDDSVNPVTVYGKLMAEAEAAILEGYPETAVLRVALPMGPSLNGHAGAIDWIESRFRKGKPATLYFDEVRSNLYAQDLTKVIAAFCANDASGIWHVGGPLPLSLYRIAQVINRLGNYPSELLMGCPRAAAGPVPPRAGDVSMDMSKLRSLLGDDAVSPWPFHPDHVPADDEWHCRRDRIFPPDAIARYLYGYGTAVPRVVF